MLFRIAVLVGFLVCSYAQAVTLMRPTTNSYGYDGYKWLDNSSNFYLETTIENDAKDIITSEALEQLFTLQMKNFVRDIKLVTYKESDAQIVQLMNKWMFLDLDLRKYNEHNSIYFGSLTIRINPDVYTEIGENPDKKNPRTYLISTPIANSKSEMRTEIQNLLNKIVQELASDYYWIAEYEEDIQTND